MKCKCCGKEIQPKIAWPSLDSIYPAVEAIYDEMEASDLHIGMVKAMLEGYVVAYKASEFLKYEAEIQGSIEVSNIYGKEPAVTLAYKTDARVTTMDRQAYYLFETKTTSAQDMAKFLKLLGFDDQADIYLYCDSQKTVEKPIGVIYNVIRKAKLRQSPVESDEHFVGRLKDAYMADANKPAEERKYYFREKVYRNPEQLAAFIEETRRVMSDMENYMPYKSPKRCGDYSGCPYALLCYGGGSPKDYLRKTAIHEELVHDK